MASPNSSQARVFASTTTRAALRLACRYPSAASGVPQANRQLREAAVDNGGGEHGPLWLNISNLPRDPVEAPPEVGVDDLSDRGFGQTFPADPLQYAWVCRVCPASSPAIGSNSPPGGDQLTAPPLSSPECPRHTAEGQMINHKVDHRPTA